MLTVPVIVERCKSKSLDGRARSQTATAQSADDTVFCGPTTKQLTLALAASGAPPRFILGAPRRKTLCAAQRAAASCTGRRSNRGRAAAWVSTPGPLSPSPSTAFGSVCSTGRTRGSTLTEWLVELCRAPPGEVYGQDARTEPHSHHGSRSGAYAGFLQFCVWRSRICSH